MADVKISALPAVTTPASTDEFPVNQGGTTKKQTRAQVHTLESGEELGTATDVDLKLAPGGTGNLIVAAANGIGTNVKTATSEETAMSGAAVTASNLIPAGSFVLGVTVRVTTEIEGATTFTIGDGSDVDRWGTGIALAAGTTTTIADFTAAGFGQFVAANDVVLTATGSDFTAGAVRITVHYLDLTAATS